MLCGVMRCFIGRIQERYGLDLPQDASGKYRFRSGFPTNCDIPDDDCIRGGRSKVQLSRNKDVDRKSALNRWNIFQARLVEPRKMYQNVAHEAFLLGKPAQKYLRQAAVFTPWQENAEMRWRTRACIH